MTRPTTTGWRSPNTSSRCFARAGGRRAVLTGSCIEYGSDGGVLSESSPARPDTVYGRCKLDAGLRALEVAERHDHLTVTVAGSSSSSDDSKNPTDSFLTSSRQLLNGHTAELSSGTQRRDYMHAWDVALGLIALADRDLPGYVNIGMGASISVRELSQMIGETLGRSDLLWFGARPGGAGPGFGDHRRHRTHHARRRTGDPGSISRRRRPMS